VDLVTFKDMGPGQSSQESFFGRRVNLWGRVDQDFLVSALLLFLISAAHVMTK
jgi:hypothetical protein